MPRDRFSMATRLPIAPLSLFLAVATLALLPTSASLARPWLPEECGGNWLGANTCRFRCWPGARVTAEGSVDAFPVLNAGFQVVGSCGGSSAGCGKFVGGGATSCTNTGDPALTGGDGVCSVVGHLKGTYRCKAA